MNNLIKVLVVSVFIATGGLLHAEGKGGQLFVADTQQLIKYLDLKGYQISNVDEINRDFISMQYDLATKNKKTDKQEMKKVVYKNLKSLKDVLTAEQYRKYVAILNITHYNQQVQSPKNCNLTETDCLTFYK